jgi:ATP-binding cassette subfamily B protein
MIDTTTACESTTAKTQSIEPYVIEFVTRYVGYFIALLTIAVGSASFEILVEYKIKQIIDLIAQHHDQQIFHLITLFVVYKAMAHLVYFFMRIVNLHYAPRIIKKTLLDICMQTYHHSLHWFDSQRSGDIASKIADFQEGITTIIESTFRVVTVILTVCIGLVFRQNAIGIINDGIVNIFGIKIIGRVGQEVNNALIPAIHQWQDKDRIRRRFDTFVVDSIDTVLIVLMSAVQIYLLAYALLRGEITAGIFAFVAMLTLKIHTQLNTLIEAMLFSITPNMARVQSAYQLLYAADEVTDQPDAKTQVRIKGQVHFDAVTFRYDERQRDVLKNFTLSIQPGEQVGLVGLSGAGKTTVIKCLLRYFDIRHGDIQLDQHSIRTISQESLRQNISLIPQDITLFHRSIIDNLRLARPNATHKAVEQACRKANIHDDIMDMPDQYATIVGERGVKLSGGQRQRIAIARAILKDAPILILDEATSSLDSPTEKRIQSSINQMLDESRATVIAIAHRLSTLVQMDRIVVLDKGQIVEQGSHHELIEKNGHYRRLWDTQMI